MDNASLRFSSWSCCTLLVSAACTTLRTVDPRLSLDELKLLNDSLRDREVEVAVVRDSDSLPKMKVSNVVVDAVAVGWTDTLGERQHAPIESVRSLRYLSADHPRARGFWEGAGAGVIGGVAVGALIGFALGDDPPCAPNGSFCFRGTGSEKAVAGAFIAALVGLCVGGAFGSAIGHHDEVLLIEVP